MIMKFRKNILALSVTTALLGLTACGVTPQDEGTGEKAGKASGLAVDGYLAGATVFADTNNNNRLDAWEPRALTDSDGYFSYNPTANSGAGKNYCESDSTVDQLYCLASPIGYDEVTLRISGGYDLTTMEKFSGTLSMTLKVTDNVITTPQMATPITAMLAHLTEAQQAALLAAENIVADDASKDFLDSSTVADEAEQRKLLNLALKTHKVVDMIAGRLNLLFDQDVLANPSDTSLVASAKGLFGEKKGVATNGTALVYDAIAEQIADGTGVSAIMADSTLMETVVNQSWQNFTAVVDAYNDRLLANEEDGTLLSELSDRYLAPDSVDPTKVTEIAADAVALADVADSVFSSSLSEVDIVDDKNTADTTDDITRTSSIGEDVAARIKALDIVTALMRSGNNKDTAETNNAIDLAKNNAAYLRNLRSVKVDVSGLKDKFLKGSGNLTETAADYDGRSSFKDLLGQDIASTAGLTVNNTDGMVNNSLSVSDNGKDTSISFLPPKDADPDNPDLAATNGVIEISGAILDEIFASDSSSGSSDATDGETSTSKLEGTWEQLDEYTMLMNVEIAGVNQPVIIKPTLDESGAEAYYLDVGGEQKLWTP